MTTAIHSTMSRPLAARLAVASLVAALALAGCGKPKPTPSAAPHLASAAGPAASAAPAPTAAPDSGVSSDSPADIANRLLVGSFDFDALDFSNGEPLSCDSNRGPGDAWAVHCQASPRDAQRDGRPAMVEIQLFDHDVDLDTAAQPLKDHIAGLDQEWQLSNTPDITLSNKRAGTSAKLPTICRQALGARDSPGYCELLANPRMVIVTGVMPLHASTHSLSVSADNSKPDSSQDTSRAADLAIMVLSQVNDKL